MSHDSARGRRNLQCPWTPDYGSSSTPHTDYWSASQAAILPWRCSSSAAAAAGKASATMHADGPRNTITGEMRWSHSPHGRRGVVRGSLTGFIGVFPSYAMRWYRFFAAARHAAGHKPPTCVRDTSARDACPRNMPLYLTLEVGGIQSPPSKPQGHMWVGG